MAVCSRQEMRISLDSPHSFVCVYTCIHNIMHIHMYYVQVPICMYVGIVLCISHVSKFNRQCIV